MKYYLYFDYYSKIEESLQSGNIHEDGFSRTLSRVWLDDMS